MDREFRSKNRSLSARLRSCYMCEYFDGGGISRVEECIMSNVPIEGDCNNPRSGRFQTLSHDSCDEYLSSSS